MAKKPKVMFIKYHEAADQQPLSKKAAEKLGIFPSLALGGLAAWIRQHGYPVQLIDLHVENIYPQQAADRVREFDPQIVALTSKTLGWPAVLEIAMMVREAVPKAIIVVGGPHMSIYAKDSLSWDIFDIAVVNDGEETFLEICERIEQGCGLEDMTDILGTCARLPSGEVIQNPPRPVPRDINKYPMTAWDLIPTSDYHCLTLLKPFATMIIVQNQQSTWQPLPHPCGDY